MSDREHTWAETTGWIATVKPPRLDGVRVLVVMEEPPTADLIKTVLHRYGAEVVVAPSAAEALTAQARLRSDVVVIDLGRFHADGYDLIGQIRALEPERGQHPPALALTAHGNAEDWRRALVAGYQIYMAKPIEARALVASVASLAGRTGEPPEPKG